ILPSHAGRPLGARAPTGLLAEVAAQARVALRAERVEQPAQLVEAIRAQLPAQASIERTGGAALRVQVLVATIRPRHGLLAPARRRGHHVEVAQLAQVRADRGRALAADPQFASDPGDGRSWLASADAQHPTIGEPTLGEAGVGHGLVDLALVAHPCTAQGRT